MKGSLVGFLRRPGAAAALVTAAIAAACGLMPASAQAQAAPCQNVARLEISSVGTNPRYMSFRIFNISTGALFARITIGKVESPLIAMVPLLEHDIRLGRSVAYAFAQTADPVAVLPTYLPVYDAPASLTAFEVGIQDCTVN